MGEQYQDYEPGKVLDNCTCEHGEDQHSFGSCDDVTCLCEGDWVKPEQVKRDDVQD